MKDFRNDAARNDHRGAMAFRSQDKALAEPVDKEDDPNLLVQRKSVGINNRNPYKAIRRVKRISDEFAGWADEDDLIVRTREDHAPSTQKFSVSSLGSFKRDYALNVQVFRKQQDNWLRILPTAA